MKTVLFYKLNTPQKKSSKKKAEKVEKTEKGKRNHSAKVKLFLINNKAFMLLASMLLFGVFVGSIFYGKLSQNPSFDLNKMFISNFLSMKKSSTLYLFTSSLSINFLFITITFLLGLSLWGGVFCPVIPFLKGVTIGILESYLFFKFSISGIFFELAVILPGAFISCLAIIYMSREAVKTSYLLFGDAFSLGSSKSSQKDEIKFYFLRTGCVLILVVISSLVDVVCNFFFSRFFNFI